MKLMHIVYRSGKSFQHSRHHLLSATEKECQIQSKVVETSLPLNINICNFVDFFYSKSLHPLYKQFCCVKRVFNRFLIKKKQQFCMWFFSVGIYSLWSELDEEILSHPIKNYVYYSYHRSHYHFFFCCRINKVDRAEK